VVLQREVGNGWGGDKLVEFVIGRGRRRIGSGAGEFGEGEGREEVGEDGVEGEQR